MQAPTGEAYYIDRVAFVHILDGRLLVAYDIHDNRWFIAGGSIRDGETRRQALAREVREELGLEIDPDEPVELGVVVCPAAGRENCFVRMYCFLGSLTEMPRPSGEISQVRYITSVEIGLLPMAGQYCMQYLRQNALVG